MRLHRGLGFAVVAVLAFLGQSARADFTIDQLINGTANGTQTVGGVTFTGVGNGIIVGDKLFTNFGYSHTGDMPTALGVNVTGIHDVFGNIGIRFQGGFNDSPFSAGPSDALITYTVQVLNPAFRISDAHIFGNPTVALGSGIISVNETFTSPGTILPNSMLIGASSVGGTNTTVLSDSTIFGTPVSVLNVQKDIFAIAGTGFPQMSFVDQTFSQVSIPEPGSFALLGLGLIGTGFAAYRRRKMA